MSWKDWPRWKKFGIVFLEIFFIKTLILYLTLFFTNSNTGGSILLRFLSISKAAPLINLIIISFLGKDVFYLSYFFGYIFKIYPSLSYLIFGALFLIISNILIAIFYFFIGAFIGWLVGKLKKKK